MHATLKLFNPELHYTTDCDPAGLQSGCSHISATARLVRLFAHGLGVLAPGCFYVGWSPWLGMLIPTCLLGAAAGLYRSAQANSLHVTKLPQLL